MAHIIRARFLVAVAASAALVLSAPFLGLIRSRLRTAFPDSFVWIVGGLVGAGVLLAVASAVVRIRDRRLQRYAAILTALAIATGYAFFNASTNRDSDIVELFHFLQYGAVALLFYRACRGNGDPSLIVLPLLAGLIVGAAEEWFQWFLPVRVGEIRDLYLNLAAIACGLLFSLGLDPPAAFTRRLRPGSARLIGRFAAAAILALAVFIQVIHLGYAIDDDEAGTFTSRYSREQLLALQAGKAAEWRARPFPTAVRRLSREDQYMTEGAQRARWRNEKWAEGDILAAWNENRILEKYFDPVLDTPSYISITGHRWPAGQRADAEKRAASQRSTGPARVYVSGAYPYPIFVWPRVLFWAAVALLVSGVLLATRLSESRSQETRDASARFGGW